MSYSFNVRAADKLAAVAAVAAKLQEVEQQQPAHTIDRTHAQAAAEAFIALLPDNEDKDISVSMNGYVSGQWQGQDILRLWSASVTVSVGFVERQPA